MGIPYLTLIRWKEGESRACSTIMLREAHPKSLMTIPQQLNVTKFEKLTLQNSTGQILLGRTLVSQYHHLSSASESWTETLKPGASKFCRIWHHQCTEDRRNSIFTLPQLQTAIYPVQHLLGEVIRGHGVWCHQHAGDAQVYLFLIRPCKAVEFLICVWIRSWRNKGK